MGNITNTVLTSKDQGLAKERQKNARDNIGAMAKVTGSVNDVLVIGPGGEAKDSGFYLDPGGFIVRQADWTEEDPESPAYIKHKPDLDGYATKEEVATKAEKEYVDETFPTKTYVAETFPTKSEVEVTYASKAYVDTGLADSKAYVDTNFPTKQYVDGELVKKASKTYVDMGLAGKVDKVQGKGLSTNDFSDADKAKLDSIGNKPAEQGGTEESLVTTGEKYEWNHKLDDNTYFLNGASVTESGGVSTLTITGSDGGQVVFTVSTGEEAIKTISADGSVLPIDTDKNVDIPLATSNTADEYGDAGLVRGIFKRFT